jgi:hypothetical protein
MTATRGFTRAMSRRLWSEEKPRAKQPEPSSRVLSFSSNPSQILADNAFHGIQGLPEARPETGEAAIRQARAAAESFLHKSQAGT